MFKSPVLHFVRFIKDVIQIHKINELKWILSFFDKDLYRNIIIFDANFP